MFCYLSKRVSTEAIQFKNSTVIKNVHKGKKVKDKVLI